MARGNLGVEFIEFAPQGKGGALPALIVLGLAAAGAYALIASAAKQKSSNTVQGRWPGPQIELFPYDYFQSLYR